VESGFFSALFLERWILGCEMYDLPSNFSSFTLRFRKKGSRPDRFHLSFDMVSDFLFLTEEEEEEEVTFGEEFLETEVELSLEE